MKKIKILGRLLLQLLHRKTQNKRGKFKSLVSKHVTEDMWFEIFLHLPLDSVFKFRCVSKVWFSVLSDPNFIKKWYKLNYSSLPWALVHYPPKDHSKGNSNKWRKMFTIAANPDSHSRFASHHHNGFSFSFLKNPSNYKEMTGLYVLGSSNGLVLCTTDLFKQTYYVCDPLTMKLVLLPPPPRKSKWVVNGFICNDDEESTNFKVVRMSRLGKPNKFSVEIFSSDLGKWNSYRVLRHQDVTLGASFYCHPIIHNGVIYLVEKQDWILAFNLNNNTSSLIKLPGVESAEDESNLPPDEYCNRHCLGVSEGMICFSTIKRLDMNLSVWALVLEEEWHLLHEDTISEDLLAEIESLLFGRAGSSCFAGDDFSIDIKVLGFSPLDQNVVKLGSRKFIWSYNIRTRRYKQLCDPSSLSTAHFLS